MGSKAALSSFFVYPCRGLLNIVSTEPVSTILPDSITAISSEINGLATLLKVKAIPSFGTVIELEVE